MKAKKILSAVLTLGVIATCGFVGCGEGEKTAQAPLPGADKPSVEQYDGTIMQAGGTYGLTSKMAFMSDTTNPTSDFEAINTEIVATVYPADADQRVRWSVKGFESSTAWTQGKSATDYVSISTDANDSKRANVKCLAPFAEQIIIECASVENPSIKSSCTLDFVQAVKSVDINIGGTKINLGDKTDIAWEINPNAGAYLGGAVNVNITTYSAYTVANDYKWDVDLISPEYFETGADDADWGVAPTEFGEYEIAEIGFNDGFLKIESSEQLYDAGEAPGVEEFEKCLDLHAKRYENISTLYFNSAFLEECLLWQRTYTQKVVSFGETEYHVQHAPKPLSDYSTDPAEQLALLSKMTESSLYTLRLTVESDGIYSDYKKEFCSLINVAEFTNTPVVKSVTLSETSYKF